MTMMARWILALVLAAAAGLKMGGVGQSDTMFGALAGWLQWVLVAAELVLAAWLISGRWPRMAALAAIVMLSVFMGAIILEMGKEQPKSCGCFGQGQVDPAAVSRGLWTSLGIDTLLLGLALGAYYGAGRRPVRPVTGAIPTQASPG